ncbi:glycosyltransferase family 39 protein [Stenotrophomonas sp.]|uniref:ArnT family glycosyltransferase n=1 Tax=Stenotrophomonas sp. TaxID=69392 RepID=UPI0028A17D91|nr:glycosyltransferase family 39 protein [Stenotrophomonas sp.]
MALLLLWMWSAFQASPRYANQLQAEAVQMDGFSVEGDGFRASGHHPSHMLTGQFRLKPNHRYAFSFSIDAAPGAPAAVVVDLYGNGYDNPAQERSFRTRPGQTTGTWMEAIDVGPDVPDVVSLRIFYDGAPGLLISDIRVVEIPAWRIWVRHLLLLLALAAGVAFVAVVARWTQEEEAAPSVPPVPWAQLCALWLGVSLIRFVAVQLLPYWSGDEYAYKMIASGIWTGGGRAGIPGAEQIQHPTNLPSMLYPYLIAPSFAFGDAFYSGIRLINALVVSSGLIPAYLVARRILGHRLSLFVAVASVLLPGVFISAYAVTEVLYFPLYLWTVWSGLRYLERPGSVAAAIAFGVWIGVLLNVRLNGITLLIALLMAMALVSLRERSVMQLLKRPTWLLVPPVSYLVFKGISINVSAADDGGSLGMYDGKLQGWHHTLMSDMHGAVGLLLGHLTILAIPFALSLAGGIALLLPWRNQRHPAPQWNATLFLLLATAGAIGMAIVFTVGISPIDLGGLGRWHSRYYFASFPLLLALLFLPCPSREREPLAWYAYAGVIMAVLGAAAVFVMVLKLHASPWFGSTVDSMEAQWYRFSRWWLVGFSLLVLAIAAAREGWLRRTLQLTLLAAWLVVGNAGTWRNLSSSPGAHDPGCGTLAQEIVAHEPGGVAVLGSNRREFVDNAFFLPNMPVFMRMLPDGGPVDGRTLADARYVLADAKIEVTHATRLKGTGSCSIYKVDSHEQ